MKQASEHRGSSGLPSGCCLAISLIFIFTPVSGVTIDVPGDEPTIQAGIDAASDDDTVVVAADTYTGTGNTDLDFGGKRITVRSASGAASCTIDCEDSARAFHFHSGESLGSVVDGFRIIRGRATFPGSGGAIFCELSSNPTIRNCVISGCSSALHGGAVACIGALAVLEDCTITGNTAVHRGGGVCIDIDAVIMVPVIVRCVISDNVASGPWSEGGGLSFSGDALAGTPVMVANSLITGNSAATSGGGVHFKNSSHVGMVNCTVCDNSAGSITLGQQLHCDDGTALTVTNCILWNDASNYEAPVALTGSSQLTISYSNTWNGTYGINVFSGCTLDFDYDTNIGWDWINGEDEPLFAGAGDYHLTAASPCIDTGTATGAPGDDIDGQPRPQGAGYDMGSDEYVFACPVLSGNYVSPASGTTTRSFRLSIDYDHPDAVPPGTMQVVIDGTPHDMTLVLGTPADGKYAFDIIGGTLGIGSHSHYFTCVDEHGCAARLPAAGSFDGPTVENNSPVLNNGSLTPERGDLATEFAFRVRYYDADGHLPTAIDVVIDGTPHAMSLCSGTGSNGYYCYDTTGSAISVGTHTYHFHCTDEYGGSDRLPEAGESTIDILEENHCPTLANGAVDPGGGDTTTIFRFTVDYHDPNGTPPVTTNVVIDGQSRPMSLLEGTPADGTYYLDTQLAPETSFYFSFDDGYGCSVRLPAAGTMTGPAVTGLTFLVPGDYPTIMEAVVVCNSHDVILVADGVYTGPENKNIDFGSKTITLRSENGAHHCVIDCEGDGRGIHISNAGAAGSVIDGLTIINGVTTGNGGGILCAADITIRNCRILGNAAQHGGGIFSSNAYPTIVNCLVSGNLASPTSGWGGGISARQSAPVPGFTVTNCTISGNRAAHGGGIALLSFGYISICAMDVANTILYGNSAGSGAQVGIMIGFADMTISYCDVQGGEAGIGGTVTWGAGNIDADPQFAVPVDPAAAPTTAGNLRLLVGSPAIDAGDDAANPLDTDLAGLPRRLGTIDLGAYEGGFITFTSLHPGLDPQADDNRNGRSNFIDYACGGDPLGPHDPAILPDLDGTQFTCSHRDYAADVHPAFQKSTDLASWQTMVPGVDYMVVETITVGVRRQLILDVSALTATHPALFFREQFAPGS
jgi:hypothetical protein